ncbi:DNA primase [Mycoplasmopsis citelli]|uniref:DNA primase n=1 Tax=Mycoplasmopsis citelli TaxID=171281 RepID=A0A449B0T9_9BACT|nr:DNA primase [Mycoplasmopsis citelli]VEU74229.1 DNA primase [Mycoplasmopsis citelli]
MKNISSDTIDLIIRSSNIVNVISQFIPLTKKGNNYVGVCPFHADTSPSLTVSESKNIYKCFSCGHSGNVIHFVKEFKKIPYMQALEFLAHEANLPINFEQFKKVEQVSRDPQKQKIYDLLDIANSFFKLNVTNELAQKFLDLRKINHSEIIQKFDLGFAPLTNYAEILKTNNLYSDLDLNKVGLINDDLNLIFKNRVTFGIKNQYGEIVGFSGRSLNNDKNYAKYLNSPESQLFKKSQILYNFHNAKETALEKRQVIIVEGFMDVIALDQAGAHNTIALMGTALTKDHLRLLKDLKIILFLDNDNAGQSATYKSLLKLIENRFDVEVVINDFNKDPDEIFHAHGKEVLLDILENSRKKGEHIVYENLKKQYRISEISFDVNSVNFDLFKQNLTTLFARSSANTQKIIQERFKKEFNIQIPLYNNDSFIQNTNIQDHVNIKEPKKNSFSLEKSIIYGNVKMEVLLACLVNYHLRDLINHDVNLYNQRQINKVLNKFSIFANFMYFQNDNEPNLEQTFKEILALNLNYQLNDVSNQEDIKEQFINKIKEQIVFFYRNLNPEEVTKEIKEYLNTHQESINSISPETFSHNFYVKMLTKKLELKLSKELTNLVKRNSNNGNVPAFILDFLTKIKASQK